MQKLFSILFCAVMICSVGVAFAQEDVNARFQAMAEGNGVVNPKLDQNGNLASFMVIGHGQVRKSLPKQKAVLMAKKEAERDARNQVSKYFNTSVKWAEDASGEMVCKTVGTAAGDEEGSGQSMEESATTDVSSERSHAASEAALSGLRWVWTGYDSTGALVQIYGWKFADVKALVNASKAMGAAARETVNQAKAVEGARLQDPNAAYQRAEARDGNVPPPPRPAAPAPIVPRAGQNATPRPTSSAASDAADFF